MRRPYDQRVPVDGSFCAGSGVDPGTAEAPAGSDELPVAGSGASEGSVAGAGTASGADGSAAGTGAVLESAAPVELAAPSAAGGVVVSTGAAVPGVGPPPPAFVAACWIAARMSCVGGL